MTAIGLEPLPTPRRPFPIVIVGAGGIVKDAHLPAYGLAGFPVWGICDLVLERANLVAKQFGIERAFDDLDAMIRQAPEDAVFDVAIPAAYLPAVLGKLPAGASVLLQKPMGETWEQAKAILSLCRERKLKASVNCQLRYAPFVRAARALVDRGEIGELIDVEMRLNVDTPWHLFPYMKGIPRVEILYHSVHYIDLMRSFAGEPRGMMARSYRHPDLPEFAGIRSTIIMDYPDPLRVTITSNHLHRFGSRHQESYLKWEGTRGSVKAIIGLLLDYPRGGKDRFEYCRRSPEGAAEWREEKLEGSWFPHAFIGTMADAMRWKEGSIATAPTSVEDVIKTMACVEAAYLSNERGGVAPPAAGVRD